MRPGRLLERLLAGDVGNVPFEDFERVLEALGFELRRIRGSHRIYGREGIPEQLSIQPRGGQAKPYQVRQLVRVVRQYNLKLGERR